MSALLPTLVLFILAPTVGGAQVPVVTNITESGLGTHIQPPSEGVYNIIGGTRPGDGTGPILFHSFGDFSVGQGDIAKFLNDSGLTTSNILGRVTGGNISNIYGTIQTTGFDLDGVSTNLFLVNPSGIVFGPHGSVNVGGSVSFSTAQYLRLFDSLNGVSANFYADSTNYGRLDSVFTMAPVIDFGFLSPAAYGFLTAPDSNATVTVQGSALSVSSGQSISLIGGQVAIQGDTLPDGTVQQSAHLSAPNGNIFLATAASPGEFDVTTLQALPNVDGTSFTSFGSVSLAPGSSIDVSGTKTVYVIGGQLMLSVNHATLTTTESSAPQDTDTISLGPGSAITTSNSGTGPGADVQITVGNLNLNGSAITTETLGDGIGGNITADVGKLALNGASINSNNFSFGIGKGGNLTIQGRQGADSAADSVMLTNGSVITTQTISFEHAGDVVIAAADVYLDASTISTKAFGDGKGGDVQITADSLRLENSSSITTETTFLGKMGGDVFLNVGQLSLLGGLSGGSQILSTNSTAFDLDGDGIIDVTGKGGNITIQGNQGPNSAADSVVFSGGSGITSEALSGSGGGGNISIRSTFLDLKEDSFIKSSTSGIGTDLDDDGVLDDLTNGGGNILVNVQNLRVVDGSTISSSTNLSETLAVAGGTVTVEGLQSGSQAGSVLLSGQSSGILSASAAGVPGDLTVNARTLTITNGAVISTGSAQSGPAGNVGITADSLVISAEGQIFSRSAARDAGQVTITANDELTLDNGSIVTSTTSESLGRGGNVELNVIGTVSLTNGASINSQSEVFSTGPAGNITMNAGSLMLANQSKITSSSLGTRADAGDAGNITVQSGSTVVLNNSSITTEAKEASGGEIEINAPEMVRLTNSRISTSVKGVAGDSDGGNIKIDPQFVVLQNSQILAQANAGAGGRIDIIATSAYIRDPASIVSASSTLGISGTINIQSPLQNVGGELTALSQEFSSAAALLAQQCAARAAGGTFSTFVVAAREGLPAEPGGFLASPSLTAELLGSRLSARNPQTQLSAVTGLFPKYDAKPIQLAKLGSACR